MTTPVPESVPQDGYIAMVYGGTHEGSITFVNPSRADAQGYRVSASTNRVFVHPDDVAWLESRGQFTRAPIEAERSGDAVQDTAIGGVLPAETPLSELGLSKAAYDGLIAANITTIEQAQALSDATLDSIDGVGEATIAKIREWKPNATA